MRHSPDVPTALCAGVLVGAVWQLAQPVLWTPWAYGGLGAVGVLLAVVAVAAARRGVAAAWPLALACAFVMAGSTGWRAQQHAGRALLAQWEGRDVELEGVVVDLPRTTPQGVQFGFEATSARWQNEFLPAPINLQLSWYRPRAGAHDDDARGSAPAVAAGERWRLSARLKAPHGLANPGGFDQELWWWEQDVQALGTVRAGRNDAKPVRLGADAWMPIPRMRQHIRDALTQRIEDGRAAGVMAALVVGDQAAIERKDWDIFRATGVAHLVSISGLHITMFAALALVVMRQVWRALSWPWPGLLWRLPVPTAARVAAVWLATWYAAVAGWGVPAQRTVVMLAVTALLRLSGRRWPWHAVWLAAMATVLVLDPWALWQAGFWLSFVAVGVLIAALGDAPAPRGWRAHLRELARVQLLISAALAPLGLWLFGQFSFAGLLANLWAIPWVTWVVTPLAMLGVVLPPLWQLDAWCVQAMVSLLQWQASWPWAVWERAVVPTGLALLAACGGVLLVLRLPWPLRGWGVLLMWPAVAYVPARPVPGQFELVALDVGQGSGLLVRTAQHTLMFDAAAASPNGAMVASRVLLPALRAHADRLDAAVISHQDIDHSGGLPAVAARYPHAALWASFDTGLSAGRAAQRCEAGVSWQWDGVDFTFMRPQAADYGLALSTNAMSCVLWVRAAATDRPAASALLTGDMPAAQEAELVRRWPQGQRVDVLLAPHHGSKTSSSDLLLDALQPAHVIVQSGYRNHYGHPSPQVLARWRRRGIPWVNSPACGAATWHSDKPGAVSCYREAVPRYWRHRLTMADNGGDDGDDSMLAR